MAETLRIWRIYAGDDGKSRLQPIEIPMNSARFGTVSKLFKGSGVDIHRQSPGFDATWHNAPRRQMIATIAGEAEIETGDGQMLKSRPGVIHVVEDLTGQGHITRVTGSEDRISLFMPLDDDTKLA